MKTLTLNIYARLSLSFLVCVSSSFAQESYSPNAGSDYPINVYWGDTHLHSNLSFDSFIYNNESIGPEEAYRFAKGETLIAHNGMKVKLNRPLDFLVVADHAESMGVSYSLSVNETDVSNPEKNEQWQNRIAEIEKLKETDPKKFIELYYQLINDDFFKSNQFRKSIWQRVTQAADQYNNPGQFTAFSGYEWSAPINLHRVVVFKDDAEKTSKVTPFSALDNPDPEALWAFMNSYTKNTGGDVLAIPHNSNLSNGLAFALEDIKGNPLSRSYSERRSRWEPLLEVTQIKGDSESHPLLSPTDEFADFETLDMDIMYPGELSGQRENLKSRNITYYDSWLSRGDRNRDSAWQQTYEYGRSGLKLGLAQQAKLGVNPFKFGMIGSTDSHTGFTTTEENNFWGKMPSAEPHNKRITSPWYPGHRPTRIGWLMNAAGYAAIWAKENTREALFAAMKRKEVYATTGSRMTVRFFGGWGYEKDDAFKPDLAGIGYKKGVPMGGDLTNAPKGKTPSFLICAVKDPDGANLDRVQMIKGWRSKDGELHEKIYNVALSDKRKANWRSRAKPVGNTVNVGNATYTNTIGDHELTVVWRDPDFNNDELAFYYLRVLEIPTPKWTAYDAKYFDVKDIPEEAPMITQERAYTSPIWFSPPAIHSSVRLISEPSNERQ